MKSPRVLTHRRPAGALALIVLLALAGAPLLEAAQGAQQPSREPNQQVARTPNGGPETTASLSTDADAPPPSDWAPELLDAILSSPNSSAAEALYDAAFAVGPGVIPQLEAALKDDRTAEFAAQALAFVGGEKAEQILQQLINDPRDLDLRRFYLGSLGEYPAPEITQLLLKAVAKSDVEPDRTVTEAAIWALTVRSDPDLPADVRRSESSIQDVVIRDDADNASRVIEARFRYLASERGRNAGVSLEQAVRTYFVGALEQAPPPRAKTAAGAQPSAPEPPPAQVEVNRFTFSPDRTRVLAHATFEDPDASANYDMVLQKQLGEWKVVSVWAGAEPEKAEPTAPAPSAPKHRTPRPGSTGTSKSSQPTH
jgi:hypothetical protein